MKGNWISVNDALPQNDNEVLVYAPNCNIIGSMLIGCCFGGNKWTVYDFDKHKLSEHVTHWQLLEPPY